MPTIYKHHLEPLTYQAIHLHGKILSAGVQENQIVIWAMHDQDSPPFSTRIWVFGTGHDFTAPSWARFINTVFVGPLVFHIFTDE